jgi:hypothetical protein
VIPVHSDIGIDYCRQAMHVQSSLCNVNDLHVRHLVIDHDSLSK